MEWVEAFKSLFDELGWLANVIQILGPPLLVGTFLIRKLRKERLLNESLRSLLAAQQAHSEVLSRQLEAARQFDPRVWTQSSEQEERAGNHERAINILRSGLSRVQEALHDAHLRMATHYVSLWPDEGLAALISAQRMARIAALLKPSARGARELLRQIDEAIASESGAQQPAIDTDHIYYGSGERGHAGYNPQRPASIQPLLQRLGERAERERAAGRDYLCEAMYHRAKCVSERHCGVASETTVNAGFMWASALMRCQRHTQALKEIESLLQLGSAPAGPAAPQDIASQAVAAIEAAHERFPLFHDGKARLALELRHLRAMTLRHLKRYEDVVVAVDQLLHDARATWGGDHPCRLSLRALRGAAYGYLGLAERGLGELEEVLERGERTLGADHLTLVVARSDKISILRIIGRHQDAALEMAKAGGVV